MSFLAVAQSFRSRLLLQSPTANIAWDAFGAARYQPPTLNVATPASSLWVRPALSELREQEVYGGGWVVEVGHGFFVVQVFGPFGLSTTADELVEATADQIANAFANQRFDGIRCQAASPIYVPPDPEGVWHQINVQIPFVSQVRRQSFDMAELNGRMNFSQAANGFAVATALRVSGGVWARADQPTEVRAQAILVATQGDTFQVATHGLQGFTHGLGSSGDIWLGTNGAITTTKPDNGLTQRLGTIKNANLLLVSIEPGYIV